MSTRSAVPVGWRLAPGCAYVREVELGDALAGLTLQYPDGTRVRAAVPLAPIGHGTDLPEGMSRPLAVRFENADDGVSCSLLGMTADGPARVPIAVERGMALSARGCHAVVISKSSGAGSPGLVALSG